MTPELVIFDMAGTTIEDRGQVPAAFAETLAANNITITRMKSPASGAPRNDRRSAACFRPTFAKTPRRGRHSTPTLIVFMRNSATGCRRATGTTPFERCPARNR
jgi:beta-phosphoglucomutase-like phosphatase (HAD superfamily)